MKNFELLLDSLQKAGITATEITTENLKSNEIFENLTLSDFTEILKHYESETENIETLAKGLSDRRRKQELISKVFSLYKTINNLDSVKFFDVENETIYKVTFLAEGKKLVIKTEKVRMK